MLFKKAKVVGLFIALGVCLSMTVPVGASVGGEESEEVLTESDFIVVEDNTIMPLELATSSAKVGTGLSGSSVIAKTSFRGSNGLKSVAVKLSVQKYASGSWSTVKDWTGSTTSKNFTLTKTKNVGNGKYRAKCIFTVKTSNKSDTFTKYSSTVSK